MNRNRLLIVALVLVSALAFCTVAEACPGCAEAQAGQGAERGGIVRGYMLSIIFMMSMPFLLLTTFGGYIFLHIRRTRLEAARQADDTAKAAVESPAQLGAQPESAALGSA